MRCVPVCTRRHGKMDLVNQDPTKYFHTMTPKETPKSGFCLTGLRLHRLVLGSFGLLFFLNTFLCLIYSVSFFHISEEEMARQREWLKARNEELARERDQLIILNEDMKRQRDHLKILNEDRKKQREMAYYADHEYTGGKVTKIYK